MKKIFKGALSAICALVGVFGLTACGPHGVLFAATELGSPQKTEPIKYSEREKAEIVSVADSAEDFAARFAGEAYRQYVGKSNFAVSPLSVYMAMSLAAQCSAGETQSQILSTLNISYDMLSGGFYDFYRSVVAEYTDYAGFGEKEVLTGRISLTNSVWLDGSITAKSECVEKLAERFACYSYQTDFLNNNNDANAAIREFVKDNTNGLIDQDFNLSPQTVFTLINTLYLKDVWTTLGKGLNFSESEYDFKQADGGIKRTKLLQGFYGVGRAAEEESFKTFFARTDNGNKIQFILPRDGYTVADVFTEENISKVKRISYNGVDHEKKERYYTRCLFPEYTASYDGRVKSVMEKLGTSDLFNAGKCDFSALTDAPSYCDDIIHVTKLKVDRIGIEGAAVTVLPACGSAGPDGYTEVYEDLVIDRAFAFIISDGYGHTLFSGVVNSI